MARGSAGFLDGRERDDEQHVVARRAPDIEQLVEVIFVVGSSSVPPTSGAAQRSITVVVPIAKVLGHHALLLFRRLDASALVEILE